MPQEILPRPGTLQLNRVKNLTLILKHIFGSCVLVTVYLIVSLYYSNLPFIVVLTILNIFKMRMDIFFNIFRQ